MSESPEKTPEQDPEPSETEWERKRRLAAVFGDVLPDTTSDERDTGTSPDGPDSSASDEWLKAQVPPHHGG
ncbi:MAG: hypothetical protein Q8O61_17190 [Nocardioides sp.]|nr:hypothetical protein [Nocardioides sp.]